MLMSALALVVLAEPAIAESPGLSDPKLLNLQEVVRPEDYPVEALQAYKQGTTRIKLEIDRNGGVRNCKVVESSTVPSLDRRTCELFERRARFEPARDDKGSARAATLEIPVRWQLRGFDFPLVDSASRLSITIAKSGKPIACHFEMTSLENKTATSCVADEQMKDIRKIFRSNRLFRGRTFVIDAYVLTGDQPFPLVGHGEGEEVFARLSAELTIGADGYPVDCWMIEDSTDGGLGRGCDEFRQHNFGTPRVNSPPPRIRHLLVYYTRP